MIENIKQLENITNILKEKFLYNDVKALEFDNFIEDIMGVSDSLFDSSYNLYDGQKTYYIESLNVNLFVDYRISYENSIVFDTEIYINDIYFI